MEVGCSHLFKGRAPICKPDPLDMEVCSLPRGRIRDVNRKLSSIIQPLDYCPLLFFQVDTNGIVAGNLRSTKRGFRALGRQIRDSESEIVFSSIQIQ